MASHLTQSKNQGPSSGLQCHAWSDVCHLSGLISYFLPIATLVPATVAALLLLGHTKHWFKVSVLWTQSRYGKKPELWTYAARSNTGCVSLPARQTVLCLIFFTYKILLCVLFLWSPEELTHVYQHIPSHALILQYYTCNELYFLYGPLILRHNYPFLLSKFWSLFMAQNKY